MKARLVAASLALALFAAPGAIAQEQPEVQVAQEATVPAEVMQYLQEQPSLKDMTPQQLQQRILAGRGYMKIGSLPKPMRKRLAGQVRAARAELDARRGQGQKAKQPATGESAETAPSDSAGKAKQPSAKGNAETASGDSAQKARQQGAAGKDDADATNFLAAVADPRSLSAGELTRRLRQGRNILKNRAVSLEQRKAVSAQVRALRAEAALRKQGQGQQGEDTKPAKPGQAAKPDQTDQAAGDSVQAERIAKALIADDRASRKLDNNELRTRLNAMRSALAARNLSKPTERALRQRLADDRDELRSRLGQAGKPQGGTPDADLLADRRPAGDLKTPALRQRIIVLRDAVGSDKYNANQKDNFRARLVADRKELNGRLVAGKREREQGLRRYRDKSDVSVSINIVNTPREERPVGYAPPPVWAAEADAEDIQQQLVAPPVRTPPRRYTLEQIEEQPEIRETMPAVELDTINFGFGESFVREEELENMDKIGEVLERILAAHPDEVFLIEGHTDAVGADDSNLTLSRQRAEAVVEALASYYTIPARNLKPVGYGERYLKVDTEEPEAENRRVTIRRVTPLVGELEG